MENGIWKMDQFLAGRLLKSLSYAKFDSQSKTKIRGEH